MEQIVFNQKLANIGINGIIQHRFLWLILLLMCVIGCGFGLSGLRVDSSNESFLPESDELSLANDRFKEQFGNEEFVFILVKSENLFSHLTLSRIRKLQEDLNGRLPFAEEVNSITNAEFMETRGDSLLIEDIIADEIPTDEQQLLKIKNRLAASRLLMNRIVASDWKHAGIAITFERMPKSVWVHAEKGFSPMDEAKWPDAKIIFSDGIYSQSENSDAPGRLVEVSDPRKLITPALRAILRSHQADDFQLSATGMPVGDFEIDRITAEEGGRIGLIALGAAFLFMLILFRNPVGVIAPMVVMISAVIILFGAMGWLAVPVSIGSMFVAPLLMVISVSYSIHFINHFNFYFQRKKERLRALHYAYGQSVWPCFLTAATTAIGFGSFLIITMKPIRDVGLACGFGALISFVLVMILVPIFYSFGSVSSSVSADKPNKPLPWGMVFISNFVLRYKFLTILVSLGSLAFGAFYLSRIPIETDLMKLLGNNNAFVKESRSITAVLGGFYSYEVMIELPEGETAKSPAVLQALDKLATEADQWDVVTSTMSLVNLVKEIDFVMNNRDPEFYKIPESREQIAQYLLLYEISGGDELDNWVDYNYRQLRLSVQLAESANLGQHIKKMQALSQNLFPEGTRVTYVGDVPIMLRLMSLLTIGQLESIAAAFAMIFLVMVVILKSVRAGLISMIPNIFPVVIIAGIMGLFRINLDIMTIMIAPMIIGIAVDDTVHFFIHFKDELSGFKDYERANRQTFIKIGHALLFTSAVLILGFGILGFSSVAGIVNMGLLAAIGIMSALLADYFLTPILLVYLKPYGKFGPPTEVKPTDFKGAPKSFG